jgi:RNA polymerase sigma-70 factor (ECF subfamily)
MSANAPSDLLLSLKSESEGTSSPLARLGRKHSGQFPTLIASTDESLIWKAANGSKEALAMLFRRHRRTVLNVANRILRDTFEAEDLCQDVFLFVFQKASLFDPGKGTASSWIVQIAYSRALNRRQYLTSRQHYNSQEVNEEQIGSGVRSLFIDEILGKSLLTQLSGQLSVVQQNTLELHFFEGYSLREIAAKTGETIGNVRHHYYRGLERLRSNVFPKKDI